MYHPWGLNRHCSSGLKGPHPLHHMDAIFWLCKDVILLLEVPEKSSFVCWILFFFSRILPELNSGFSFDSNNREWNFNVFLPSICHSILIFAHRKKSWITYSSFWSSLRMRFSRRGGLAGWGDLGGRKGDRVFSALRWSFSALSCWNKAI